MTEGRNLLEPPETLLEENEPARAELDAGADPTVVAAHHPTYSAAWASLAESALRNDQYVVAYAYARTGYHRGLDALRKGGWKGFGPVPWRHEPNRGVLRSVAALARAARAIGEDDEFDRCRQLLEDSDIASLAATGVDED